MQLTLDDAVGMLKEKAGMNMLVQPTACDQVIIPMVARGEAEVGIANAMELHDALAKGGVLPLRALEEDLAISEDVLR